MEFEFSKEERVLRKAVRNFAQNELVEQEINKMEFFPRETMEKIGDLGFLRLRVPEEYGGVPASWVELGIVTEEIAKGNIAVAYLIMLSFGVSLLLTTYGTEEAKAKWLPGHCRGTTLGCIAVTEPVCGSDLSEIETQAVEDGSYYQISGEKSPISYGMNADFTILFAKTDLEAGTKGLTAFLVPLDLQGISKSGITNMGLLPVPSARLTLKEVRIPMKYQIGKEGEGFDVNTSAGLSSDFFRILSGLIPLGLAQAALSLAITHAKNRVAFGRPIAQFQAISSKIAEDATLIELGRWLCYRALWLKDQGSNPAKEAAMCSWWCPKSAYQIIEDALLIHGHAGYSDDYPIQQMLRDVIAFEMIGGTEEANKLIIGRRVIGKSAIPEGLERDGIY